MWLVLGLVGTIVLMSENGLETKSEERIYRPSFPERLSDNPTRLDELCPIFRNKNLALEKIYLYIMRNEANP